VHLLGEIGNSAHTSGHVTGPDDHGEPSGGGTSPNEHKGHASGPASVSVRASRGRTSKNVASSSKFSYFSISAISINCFVANYILYLLNIVLANNICIYLYWYDRYSSKNAT
jgi:hypothetical protein